MTTAHHKEHTMDKQTYDLEVVKYRRQWAARPLLDAQHALVTLAEQPGAYVRAERAAILMVAANHLRDYREAEVR